MSDYTNMSIQAIFDSFDTNIKNGEIDKKEEKVAKKLYGGIFTVTRGMNIDAFKASNSELLTDKDIHSTLLSKIDKSGELDKYKNSTPFDDNIFVHLRSLIRSAATYLSFRDIKISFNDLMPYIEKSDRQIQLKNAFDFLDMRDTYETISEHHYKVNYQKDSYFDPSAINSDNTWLSNLLGFPKKNIYDKEKIEKELLSKNIDCSAQDIESILLAMYLKSQDIKNNK